MSLAALCVVRSLTNVAPDPGLSPAPKSSVKKRPTGVGTGLLPSFEPEGEQATRSHLQILTVKVGGYQPGPPDSPGEAITSSAAVFRAEPLNGVMGQGVGG